MSWFSHKEKKDEPTYDWLEALKEHEKARETVNCDSATEYYHMHPTACQEYYCGLCEKMVPLSSFPHPH